MLALPESELVTHPNPYLVDGEVGRFQFETYDVRDERGRIVVRALDWLPRRTGKQWYQTIGFKEQALIYGALDRSYRKTDVALNVQRRQLEGGTPLRTLRDMAVTQGSAVLAAIEREAGQALAEHGFGDDGQPKPQPDSSTIEANVSAVQASQPPNEPRPRLPVAEVLAAWNEVAQDMQRRGFTAEQITAARPKIEDDSAIDYELPEHTTNISVDDVSVKKQKPHRKAEACQADQPANDELKRVHTSVSHIQHAGKGLTLVATSLLDVLRFTLALLLRDALGKCNLRFFVDGQRSLQDTILSYFRWHEDVRLILDWFHLVKKTKEVLSLAMRGRALRNEHAKIVLRLLWYGLVDVAISHLRSIDPSQIKDAKQIQVLIGYLERNRTWIPNYALRANLGLRNSSNPAECSNNLVTSQRQKKNGMSWSESGSHALSAIACVVLNKCTKSWLTEGKFHLSLDQAA
jgi:hypothetical protein